MRIAVFAVAAAVVAAAAAVPVSAQTAPRLAELKLTAEKARTFEEIGAGNQNGTNGNHNGNHNGNKGSYSGYYGYFGYYGYYFARPKPTAGQDTIGDLDCADVRDLDGR